MSERRVVPEIASLARIFCVRRVSRPVCVALTVTLSLVAAACAPDEPSSADPSQGATSAPAVAPAIDTTGRPAPADTPDSVVPLETSGPPEPTEPVAPTDTAAVPAPIFQSSIAEIGPDLVTRLGASWREGCPVGLDELRYLQLTHWDAVGQAVTGELVVRAEHAESIERVFSRLFEIGFPIERMELVDSSDADDDRSMAANNTSAFNCREVAGRPGVWSWHAFGAAIDINPLVNPYVTPRGVFPPEGEPFADRSVPVPGGIYAGDEVVAAFAEIGWTWGGDWSGSRDYQHFSASGR